MESKIQEAISSGDFYTAHQVILSISKHAQQILLNGVHKMVSSNQLLSAFDIANNLLEITNNAECFEQNFTYSILSDAVRSLMSFGINDNYDRFIIHIFRSSNKPDALANKILADIIQQNTKIDFPNVLDNILLTSNDINMYINGSNLFYPAMSFTDCTRLCLISIVYKNFALAASLISYLLSQDNNTENLNIEISNSSVSIPKFIRLSSAPILNFIQILFLLAQRKGIPKALYLQIKEWYSKEFQDKQLLVSPLLKLEGVIWPVKQPTRDAAIGNIFSSILRHTISQ